MISTTVEQLVPGDICMTRYDALWAYLVIRVERLDDMDFPPGHVRLTVMMLGQSRLQTVVTSGAERVQRVKGAGG